MRLYDFEQQKSVKERKFPYERPSAIYAESLIPRSLRWLWLGFHSLSPSAKGSRTWFHVFRPQRERASQAHLLALRSKGESVCEFESKCIASCIFTPIVKLYNDKKKTLFFFFAFVSPSFRDIVEPRDYLFKREREREKKEQDREEIKPVLRSFVDI